jgi:hypothetical protein
MTNVVNPVLTNLLPQPLSGFMRLETASSRPLVPSLDYFFVHGESPKLSGAQVAGGDTFAENEIWGEHVLLR